MNLPAPRDTLAGCVWLPRILAKGRQLEAGSLPAEYTERFCHPGGVDNQFLTFFGLTRDEILKASRLNDEMAAQWFAGLPSASPAKITEWNHIAENMGRPGFPLAARLPIALATTYRNLDATSITTVFEALEADENF